MDSRREVPPQSEGKIVVFFNPPPNRGVKKTRFFFKIFGKKIPWLENGLSQSCFFKYRSVSCVFFSWKGTWPLAIAFSPENTKKSDSTPSEPSWMLRGTWTPQSQMSVTAASALVFLHNNTIGKIKVQRLLLAFCTSNLQGPTHSLFLQYLRCAVIVEDFRFRLLCGFPGGCGACFGVSHSSSCCCHENKDPRNGT